MSKKPRLQIYRFNPNVKGLFLEHWSKSVFENEENDGKKRLLRSIVSLKFCFEGFKKRN